MFSGLFRKKQKTDVTEKLNLTNVFNKQEDFKGSESNNNFIFNTSQKRINDFEVTLNAPIVNLQHLKKISWDGIPENYRSKAWKILLKYMPTNKQTQQTTLKRKRKDYFQMVQTYIQNPTLQRDAHEKKIYKLINDDVVRTLPQATLFRHEKIQLLMRRLLYVWHMRHPASGYVQGINDIVTPFVVVYLSNYAKINMKTLEEPKELQTISDQMLNIVQADSYWCLSKILDGVLDNYTSSWPGIQKSFIKLKQIIKRVDQHLIQHFQSQNIDFYHLYFKWVTCLLLRQFTLKIGLRLYDTYISDENNYSNLCLYVLAAIILKYAKKFKKMNFEEMMGFQQNMPTKEWSEEDLTIVIAQAYVYQGLFQN